MAEFIFQEIKAICVFVAALIGFIAMVKPGFPRWLSREGKGFWAMITRKNTLAQTLICWTVLAVALGLYGLNVSLRYKNFQNERLPDIHGNVHFPYPTDFQSETNRFGFVVEMQVMNNGHPSWLWKWKCKAKLPGRGDLNSEAPHEPILTPNSPEFSKDNYLPAKLFKTPLAGGGESGWAIFAFDKRDKAALSLPGVKFEIQCEDMNGKKWTFFYERSKPVAP